MHTYRPPDHGWQEVPRVHLISSLWDSRVPRLTLVSAPTGYGKTSFAAQWYRRLRAAGGRAAWVSLDTEDREALNLLQQVIGALDQELGISRRPSDLDSASISALLQVLRGLAADMSNDLVLFLDDYHLAQSDHSEAAVFRLCSEPAFAKLRTVILSRGRPNFPLARLRLNGDIKQITAEDLKLSAAEIHELFGSANSDAECIEALMRRTEGWPIAVHMVRLLSGETLCSREIWNEFADSKDGLGHYLIEQVVSALPEPVRAFLYATAPLSAISAELAEAVTREPGAQEIFYALTEHGLPISMSDPSGQWVRYHPLLRDLLTKEAERRGLDSRTALTRAAGWFRAHGEIKAAVRHALLAGDTSFAASMVEAEGGWRLIYLTARGGLSVFRQLSSCVSDIPVERYPLTTLGLAVLYAKLGQLQVARHYFGLVIRTWRSNAVVERQGRLVHALLSLYDDSRITLGELTALEHDLSADRELGMVHRGLLLNLLSFNYLNEGRLQQSVAYGEQSVRCLKDGGAEFGALHLYIHIGQARYLSGDAHGAQTSYARLVADAREHLGEGSDLEAIGQVLRSELEVQRGKIVGVAERLTPALAHVAENDTWFDILAAGLTTRLRMALIERRFADGHIAIDEARATARRRGLQRLRALCETERVRLLIAEGELAEAQRLANQSKLGVERAQSRAENLLSTRLRGSVPALLWARLWLALGDSDKAAAALETLTTLQTEHVSAPRFIELQVVAIRIALLRKESVEAAERLVELAFRAPLVDYCGSVLEEGPEVLESFSMLAAQDRIPTTVRDRIAEIAPNLSGTAVRGDLTPREREVVVLLSEGCTNKEIGRQLEMSENTVKFHLRNLFGKLRVTTRTAAVTAARGRGMTE